MEFTIDFVYELVRLLFRGAPLLVVFILSISGLAMWIGKREGWTTSDSLYFGFITATTVGYGDFRPKQSLCKYVAIVIALLGLILTGLLVAVSVEAVSVAVNAHAVVPSAN